MDAQREPLIEFKGISKTFGTRNILNRIDFSIYEGEVTTLIGLSGTGKSVTLKHIIGMLEPDEGQILFRGQPIDKMSKREWNEYISQISYMFQNNALFDSMTVYENVAMPLKYTTKLKKKEIEARAMARIEQTELTEVADKYPSEISGGMQKRAALARALVTDPNIVLFDEPTTGQDPIRKNAILSMVAGFSSRQTINEYATVLPYSDLDEAHRIMADFTRDFQAHGIQGIEMQRGEDVSDEAGIEFSVLAGLAQGKPQIEIESVMEFARFNQKEISRFKCKVEEKS